MMYTSATGKAGSDNGMGTEIERKFLLANDSWRSMVSERLLFRQAYIHFRENSNGIVRIRIAGDQGFLTLKGPVSGCSRKEYEYEIPLEDANRMIDDFCERPFIEKFRSIVRNGADCWEIDEFLGDNQGLTVAEIELESEDAPFDRPLWLGEEVTGKPEYYNSSLARNPYKNWTEHKTQPNE